mmetsp:Transcript_41431/g.48090  ORF Transcript_41431/g.48090 Transcript_41431/m.48090 type:complete len:226 (+) Transcript_41431:19-696(+)
MEPLIERKSPLFYVVSLAAIVAPIAVYWQTFQHAENWLVISIIYCAVLFGIPFLISLLLGFDFGFLVASEAPESKHQFKRGLNFGAPITILVCGAYWFYTQNNSLKFYYNLRNQHQVYMFSLIFTFLYPFVEGIYYRMFLLRSLQVGPHELSRVIVSIVYGASYFFVFRAAVGGDDQGVIWAILCGIWCRFLIHLRHSYGGLAAMTTHMFANASVAIILCWLQQH